MEVASGGLRKKAKNADKEMKIPPYNRNVIKFKFYCETSTSQRYEFRERLELIYN